MKMFKEKKIVFCDDRLGQGEICHFALLLVFFLLIWTILSFFFGKIQCYELLALSLINIKANINLWIIDRIIFQFKPYFYDTFKAKDTMDKSFKWLMMNKFC